MYLPWMSDPATARRLTKQAAMQRFRAAALRLGWTEERVTQAAKILQATLAEVTVEEYSTPLEYIEAVEDAVRGALLVVNSACIHVY